MDVALELSHYLTSQWPKFKITCHLDRSRGFAQRRPGGVERPVFPRLIAALSTPQKPNGFAPLK